MLYLQHLGESPLPAYEPVFDWENERSMIFGQRIPETHMAQYGRFGKIIVEQNLRFVLFFGGLANYCGL